MLVELTPESLQNFLADNLPSNIKLESLRKLESPNGLGFTLWKKDENDLDCAYLCVRVYPKNIIYTIEFTFQGLPRWKRCTTTNTYKWLKKQIKSM